MDDLEEYLIFFDDDEEDYNGRRPGKGPGPSGGCASGLLLVVCIMLWILLTN